MGEESERAMSREQFYVTVSRGRSAMRLYTDNRSAVLDAIGVSTRVALLRSSHSMREWKRLCPRGASAWLGIPRAWCA